MISSVDKETSLHYPRSRCGLVSGTVDGARCPFARRRLPRIRVFGFLVVNSYKERASPMRRRKIEFHVTRAITHLRSTKDPNELCTPSIIARTEMNAVSRSLFQTKLDNRLARGSSLKTPRHANRFDVTKKGANGNAIPYKSNLISVSSAPCVAKGRLLLCLNSESHSIYRPGLEREIRTI